MTQAETTLRIVRLDRLRALAVLAVIVYHVVQMSPLPLPGIAALTKYGQYGVDLFFVLSGWLIGGLYWRELRSNGGVNLRRFWMRRWIRTLPPYFAALLISCFAVRLTRGEPFDWTYLVFLQNYRDVMPFFLVSWSLCIEEHFYIIAPVTAGALIAFAPRTWLGPLWLLLVVLSAGLRWIEWQPVKSEAFGYFTVATHLRLDGLVLGFGSSYFAVFAPKALDWFVARAHWFAGAGVACLVALELAGGQARYVLWSLTAAVFCTTLVIASGVSRNLVPDSSRVSLTFLWKPIALASYSAYLIHPLCIHAARSGAAAMGSYGYILYFPTVLLLIVVATAVFYFCVEKPSIWVRDELTSGHRAVAVRSS